MNKLPRIGTLVVFGGLVGACAQIIGLGKYDTEEQAAGGESGDAGTGGKGARGGSAGSVTAGSGNPAGGLGGSGGNAGTGIGGKGGASGGDAGTGGSEAGTGALGGDSGSGGDGATGGSTGGDAGTGGGGGSGTGGMAGKAGMGGSAGSGTGGLLGCSETIEITATGDAAMNLDGGYVSYEFNVSPQLTPCSGCSGPLADYLWIDFYSGGEYTGEQTGTFELGVGEEENYASCSRCVWLGVEFAPSPDDSGAYFFAKSGTMVIDAASDHMNGSPRLTLSGVTLEEVTIDFESTLSTRVNGGRCLHLDTATLDFENPVPAGWVCADYAYLDNFCDCGCGVLDPACASAYFTDCDNCPAEGCATDIYCGNQILPDDNSQCTADPWTCNVSYYGDGSDCDCGCGVVDIDCPSANAVDCDYCFLSDSCAETGTGSCTDFIVADDNSSCL